MKQIRRIIYFSFAMVSITLASAATAELPKHTPIPGGVAVLPISPVSSPRPLARFGNREVLVSRAGDNWFAIVGLPCEILPGNYIVRVESEPGEFGSVELSVSPIAPDLPHQNNDGTSANARAGEKTHKQLSQIVTSPVAEEAELLNPNLKPVARNKVMFSGAVEPDFDFVSVADFTESIAYGKLIRDKQMVTHDYISYLGTPGDQVYSPSAGNVVKVIESENQGYTIHISHGGGVFSILGHLWEVLVHEGQPLDPGEQVGSMRQMNNSERGKLDWGVQMNGFLVNPLILGTNPSSRSS